MTISVLLADDRQIIRTAVKNLLLRDPDIQVVAEAADFNQTIELATTLKPQIVVLDLHMGDDKYVVPSDLKLRLAGSRLLAILIWNDDETRVLAESFGAVALLDKASLAAELIPAIKKYAIAAGPQPR